VVEAGSGQRDGLGDGPGPGIAVVGEGVGAPGAGAGGAGVGDVSVVDDPVVGVPVVVSVVDVVDVGLVVSVVVVPVVVVAGDVPVVLRGSCTFVRGTQVYEGSGTKPGGTTSVAGACTGCGAGLYSWYSHHTRQNATISATVEIRTRPPNR
jgi:hypothetical protein